MIKGIEVGAERQSQVTSELVRFSNNIDKLEKEFHCLADRLSRVLVNDGSGPINKVARDAPLPAPKGHQCAMAEELSEKNNRMEALRDMFASLRARIEA